MDRNEEWQRLIEQYRSVPVPQSVRDRIQESVVRGKKRAVKRRRMAYISTAVSGAAAVILILVLLPNLNEQMAERMGRTPVIGSFFRAVTVRDYSGTRTESAADENNMLMMPKVTSDMETVMDDADCAVPEAQCAGSAETGYGQDDNLPELAYAAGGEDVDSDGIAAYSGGSDDEGSLRAMDSDTDGYTQRLVEHFEAENERDGGRFTLTGYEIVTDSDEWFTLIIYANENEDADTECRTYYNVDKSQDALMTLGELYNGRDYVAIISDEILSQIESKKIESSTDNTDMTETAQACGQTSFTRINEDQNYYFNDNGDLVIVLDGSQISPDAEEHSEFIIDPSLLQ